MKSPDGNRYPRQPAVENDGNSEYAAADLLLAMVSLENSLEEVDARERELITLYHGGEIGGRNYNRESETIAYKRYIIEEQLQRCRDLLSQVNNPISARSKRFARGIFRLDSKSGSDNK